MVSIPSNWQSNWDREWLPPVELDHYVGIARDLVRYGVRVKLAYDIARSLVAQYGPGAQSAAGRFVDGLLAFDGKGIDDVVRQKSGGPPPTPPKTPRKRRHENDDPPRFHPYSTRSQVRAAINNGAEPSSSSSRNMPPVTRSMDVDGASRSLRFAKAQSASSGFLSTDVKWKKGGRPRKLSKFQNNGILLNYEFGFKPATESAWSNAIIFGHCTFVRDIYLKAAFMCLIKKLFNKIDITIPSFVETTMNSNIGDKIGIRYKKNYDTATTVDSMTYTVPNPVPKYDTCVGAFVTAFEALSDLNTDFHLVDMYYQTAGDDSYRAVVRLTNAKFKWNTKSAIKVQNRTQYEGQDESDDIKNVPVYGKSYEGFGTGSNSFRDQNIVNEQQFVCSGVTGLLFKQCPSASGLTEAPPPGYFNQVKKVGKIHMDPGQVKTSVLTHHLKCRQEHFFGHLADNIGGTTVLIPFGEFRFFHLEHMLKTAEDDPNLNIVGEHNLRIAMTLTTEWNNVTDDLTNNYYISYQ